MYQDCCQCPAIIITHPFNNRITCLCKHILENGRPKKIQEYTETFDMLPPPKWCPFNTLEIQQKVKKNQSRDSSSL